MATQRRIHTKLRYSSENCSTDTLSNAHPFQIKPLVIFMPRSKCPIRLPCTCAMWMHFALANWFMPDAVVDNGFGALVSANSLFAHERAEFVIPTLLQVIFIVVTLKIPSGTVLVANAA